MEFIKNYFKELKKTIDEISVEDIKKATDILYDAYKKISRYSLLEMEEVLQQHLILLVTLVKGHSREFTIKKKSDSEQYH